LSAAGDGPAAADLAAGLDHIAGLPPGARPTAATALLSQADAWDRTGRLSDTAYQETAPLLTAVGGVVTQPATHRPAVPKRDDGPGKD
jgi:hypothetical protein